MTSIIFTASVTPYRIIELPSEDIEPIAIDGNENNIGTYYSSVDIILKLENGVPNEMELYF